MDFIMIVNIAVLVFLGSCVISGYKAGFLLKLLGILSFFVIGILSWWLSGYISKFIMLYPIKQELSGTGVLETLFQNQLNRMVIFVILFVLMNIVVFLLKPIAKLIGSIPVVSTLNKVGGCVLGFAQAVLMLILVTMVLRLPFFSEGDRIANSSLLRYSDPIAKTATFYCQEPIKELQKIQSAMDKKDNLSEKEISAIEKWLLEQNIEKGVADEFVASLRN